MTGVTWTQLNQATANGDTLAMVANSNWGTRGRSNETIPLGGNLEFTSSNTNSTQYVMCGAGKDPYTGLGYQTIEYCIYIQGGGSFAIYESGSQVASSTTTYNAQTVWKVDISSSGVVKYYAGANLLYTSSTTASGNYYMHASGISASNIVGSYDTGIVNQQLKVEFYPTGNNQNPSSGNQNLKVEFYPSGNEQVSGTPSSSTWKWWIGMRYGTRKRYGTNHIKRMRL